MALNLYDNLAGLKHHVLGWMRQMLSYPIDRFICAMRDQGLDVKEAGGSCPICGYAQALIHLPNGWSLKGCSATEFRRLSSEKKFMQLFVDNPGSAVPSAGMNLPR